MCGHFMSKNQFSFGPVTLFSRTRKIGIEGKMETFIARGTTFTFRGSVFSEAMETADV